jgi:hypothetical protein
MDDKSQDLTGCSSLNFHMSATNHYPLALLVCQDTRKTLWATTHSPNHIRAKDQTSGPLLPRLGAGSLANDRPGALLWTEWSGASTGTNA